MMRLATALLVSVMIATPAAAALAPQYYQQARDDAPEVIVMTVDKVVAPKARGEEVCRLSGEVLKVERGQAYREGQKIELAVPCQAPGSVPRAGPVIWQLPRELKKARTARAWLKAPGELALYQFQILGLR